MTRAAGTSVENNFVKGLITEATGMNFPENAASETYDCIFKPIGAVVRRQGFQQEAGGVFQSVTSDRSAVAEFTWNNVGNIGNLTFVVQQVGFTLYFFEVSGGSLSAGLKSSTINLNSYRTSGSPTTSDGRVCQFSYGDGRLFVTHPYCEPFYVEYDLGSDSLAGTVIHTYIRDFKRQNDGYAVDERPTSLTDLHKYNLYNQGWFFSGATTSGTQNVLNYFHSSSGKYPSNSDIWWLFKNADEECDSSNFDKVYTGNTAAPGGHYIIPAFDSTRQTQSGISGILEDTAGTARPACNAFYAGRLWMAGTAAIGFGDKIYFSQIIEDVNQVGLCHQLTDPTSEQDSDLLPSDGGVVVIPGVGTVVRLHVTGNNLIVFASNGIWTISGSSGSGFFANDYAVQKISEHPAVGSMSVVSAEGALLWWNYNGIYLLSQDATGVPTVQSASDPTIKSFFEEIPQDSIPYVKGAYNSVDMLIQWLYRSTSAATVEDSFKYDRIMNLRTNTQAFYPWTISTTDDLASSPSVSGIVAIQGVGLSRTDDIVVANGQTVIQG